MFSTSVRTVVRAQDKLDERLFGDCISLWPSVILQSRGARSIKGGLCACLCFIPDTTVCRSLMNTREGRGYKGSAFAGVFPSLFYFQLGWSLQDHTLWGRGWERLTGSWTSVGRPSYQLGLSEHVSPPMGPVFLGCYFRARTGPIVCHKNVRGLFAKLFRHFQNPKGKQTCSDLFSLNPILSLTQHLRRWVIPGKKVHG